MRKSIVVFVTMLFLLLMGCKKGGSGAPLEVKPTAMFYLNVKGLFASKLFKNNPMLQKYFNKENISKDQKDKKFLECMGIKNMRSFFASVKDLIILTEEKDLVSSFKSENNFFNKGLVIVTTSLDGKKLEKCLPLSVNKKVKIKKIGNIFTLKVDKQQVVVFPNGSALFMGSNYNGSVKLGKGAIGTGHFDKLLTNQIKDKTLYIKADNIDIPLQALEEVQSIPLIDKKIIKNLKMIDISLTAEVTSGLKINSVTDTKDPKIAKHLVEVSKGSLSMGALMLKQKLQLDLNKIMKVSSNGGKIIVDINLSEDDIKKLAGLAMMGMMGM